MIEINQFYKTHEGRIVKVIVSEQMRVRSLTEQFQADYAAWKISLEEDEQARSKTIIGYRCWARGDEEEDSDYYVTEEGRTLYLYKLVSGELRYAVPLPESPVAPTDLVEQIQPTAREKKKFRERQYELVQRVALVLKVRALNVDLACEQLPPEQSIAEALKPLFPPSIVVQHIYYEDSEDGDLEEIDE